jgi:hypothetical protein
MNMTKKRRCSYCLKERGSLTKVRQYSIYDGVLLCGLCYRDMYKDCVMEPIPA